MRPHDDIGYAASKVIAQAMETEDLIRAGAVIDCLEAAGFTVLPMMQPGKVEKISEAVGTGDWRGISDWDWRAWSGAVHAGYISKETAGPLDEPCYDQDEARLSVGPGETPLPSVVAPIYDLTPVAASVVEAFCATVPLRQQAVTVMGDTVELLIEADPDLYYCEAGVPTEAVDRHAQAVRDVVKANELLAGAVAVLGHEAVDTLMRNLPDPVLRDAA